MILRPGGSSVTRCGPATIAAEKRLESARQVMVTPVGLSTSRATPIGKIAEVGQDHVELCTRCPNCKRRTAIQLTREQTEYRLRAAAQRSCARRRHLLVEHGVCRRIVTFRARHAWSRRIIGRRAGVRQSGLPALALPDTVAVVTQAVPVPLPVPQVVPTIYSRPPAAPDVSRGGRLLALSISLAC